MKDLLVIIDMVNGFVNFGALADKEINRATPAIEKLILQAKQKSVKIVAFKDTHTENDPEFKTYPPHCIEGTAECDLIPELKKYEHDMFLINKNTTDGFVTPEFLKIAKNIEYDKVVVVGCCTDICVLDFVKSYTKFNKANNRKTQMVVVQDACYTFNTPAHNAEEWHQKALTELEQLGAKIVNSSKCAEAEKSL